MRDCTATVTSTSKLPAPTPPSPVRRRLAPHVKLTRAHLALQERPAVGQEARQVLASVAVSLGQQLGVPLAFDARLADATLHPFSHLSRHALYVILEVRGGRAVVEVDVPALGALLRLAAGSDDVGALPMKLTRIEEAAFGWLVLSALAAGRAHRAFDARFRPRLLSLHTDRAEVLTQLDARQRHVAVELTLTVGDRCGQLRALVPALALQSALADADAATPGEAAAEVLAANVEARCLMGATSLVGAEVSALARGDVVLLPGLTAADGFLRGSGRLVSRSFELHGEFGPDGFTLTRAAPRGLPQEHAMNDHDPNVPVELEIELTRLRLPLSQLGTLRAGTVLALHVNGAQPVTVRIGDRAVARAELVDIEGELGARILSLL